MTSSPQDQERTIKQLPRRAAKHTRPSRLYSIIVPHGTETDTNREFASLREVNSLTWFFVFLPAFVIAWGICVKNERGLTMAVVEIRLGEEVILNHSDTTELGSD